ncbi:DUF4440 domain-containing protein [Mesorhizobium sp. BAC0120]|uniref:YybH family protein n=1 Tax=Mesorhizobium sp. BAC0120 TaxID=3090670 RepID=UPI00298C2C48|nr:DUF4440 domain-containing protein [Mesorhizobium sp. BAC0120]MDW6020907.1 DUF4440 domain-containing protein [Mesorhizobium sp. BAC0120]
MPLRTRCGDGGSTRLRILAVPILLLACFPSPSLADDAADIRTRIEDWARDFNDGRAEASCGLFSKGLISDTQGKGEADYQARCETISKVLATPGHGLRYSPDIKEIIVEGNLAIVRLNWTLSVLPGEDVSSESGLDVFRKEADGVWRIIRFMAFSNEQAPPQ